MNIEYSISEIKKISSSMFKKNFLGIFHGSISARIEHNQFVINKKDAIFDGLSDSDLTLLYSKKDYRWNDASIDADIHLNIYKNIAEAKYVCYSMPPFLTSYSINHSFFEPKDYFGYMKFGNIFIYDPKRFDDWYERAPSEICRHMIEKQTNIVVIKGYGVYVYERTAHDLAKTIALLENSCKLLNLSNGFSGNLT
ncbi:MULTISPECIES: class II aldolase and adducin N-terminal domain-containing protein [Campylobacter]|uniref:Aldolase n=1 Tax=Campylobacter vicugnae TaxID=1660076 RepID=A0A1X9T069_9BACT|nr:MULTISPECIES: class II aldolase and adducin N-terminal domain-containing protein [Campylobacter]MCR8689472.1 class II aldolase and adducin N-terminal domain-containing protein [Campylobacter sp. RM9264]MCR8701768.1 class II aldolase and adducin N-terminal domain-containing protein [Campylobacter sp. RM12176]ARR01908.1 putative aldolase [Campylobacter sp. RM8964]ARR03622.1 putative aldolase [Campylobacter sp. RM12175]MBE6429297.1 hypothetical protein [Campylobacter sp.]